MAAYLVTHSLLSSWLHLIRENPYEDLTTEGDPLAEFMLVLRREPTPRTEAMDSIECTIEYDPAVVEAFLHPPNSGQERADDGSFGDEKVL